ncbi:uncharacterized protein BJX67DRAFT_342806 [Aspergillus lucknowensis]|uniref:Mid2 domain-containing protein n=1 Tax=Aspergillus lucknowensis TaxID=176173 RepID=A0ABR4M515_9EURO
MATPAESVRTITTTFVPPADETSVVGYYSSGTGVGTIVCESQYEYLISGTDGICCPTAAAGGCGFKQRCSRSMVIYEDGSSATCANNNPCVSTTIYQREPENGWSATMAWCMIADNPTTIYRSFVGTQYVIGTPGDETLTTTSDSDPTETESTPTTTPTDTTLTTTTSPSSGLSGSSGAQRTADPEPDDDSGPNVGAIAGGVVGGVAGLALIVLALWFIFRRQRKKDAEVREIGAGYTAPEPK